MFSTSTGCAAGPRPRARAVCTPTCVSSGAGVSSRCDARRWPSRVRWNGARPTSRAANPDLASSKSRPREQQIPTSRAANPDLASSKSRPREQQMVKGGTPWGLPRLQPERQGPDRCFGLVGAAHARRARVDAFRMGRGRRLRSCSIYAGHRAGAVCGTRRRVGRHRQRGGIPRCTPRAVCIARGCRPRRRAVAAALSEAT